ncbi:site-specific DNA-methyltransferase [Polaribacter sp. Hel_I_88]|uniref:site-specific DNA-methyltransferase n=1 Tax=Polaribacter sp. Hel_I_88 TaxID=1250006 RepID=UPI00047AD9E1|nr:DNA methyltransferase [Polaribacter sp. Hel_I_88]
MSTTQKVTGNIQPPNKDVEILKQNFPNCFDKNGDFDFDKFKTQLSANEINFSTESYGMDWLGKSYARLLATDETNTLLKEDEAFNQKEANATSENLLIKGDNLEVLKHLSNAYYEKIKMIYIDPPYNTGSDGFVYEDDRKFDVPTLMELSGVSEERAKRILSFTQSKSNSHSAWLTFMYPRLYIAKHLLKEDGVIFISIDDNEVAQLRLLMDEIFGEENFLGQISRLTGTPTGQGTNGLVSEFDYILVYSKSSKMEFYGLPFNEKDKNIYNQEDSKGKYLTRPLRKTGGEDRRGDRPSMYFSLASPDGEEILPIGPTGYESRWRCSKSKYEEFKLNNLIEWKKTKSKTELKETWKPYLKFYLEGRLKQASNLWKDIDGNKKASVDLKNLLNGKYFDFPKPVELLQKCIEISIGKENSIILDFFAGSGTTGDAVMQLNAEGNGKRKFILVQLPEIIDPKSNKTAYDFVKNDLKVEIPTIFDITKERLLRASKKIKEETLKIKILEKQKEIKDLEGQLNIDQKDEKIKEIEVQIKELQKQDVGFKIFETMPIWDDYNFEAEELDAKQMQLFDESKLTKEDIKALLITWKTNDTVPLTENFIEVDLNGYTANYVSNKLYLMDKGFKTDTLKTLLEKIDSDTNFNPTTIIAFGYHFESKNLREISENVKSFANKKSIDIDFITRY